MQIIDGKATAQQIRKEITEEVNQLKAKGTKVPHLAVVLVGHDGGSETYVKFKIKDCEEVGFESTLIRYEDDVSEEVLLQQVHDLNNNNEIDGFIVQLPLPDHIDDQKILDAIDPTKDVDGFHPVNLGRLVAGLPGFVPATPSGIMQLIERYNIATEGKHCVIVGRSNIVGRPLSILLSRKTKPGNCTLTLCHSRTPDIAEHTRRADILIASLGKPEFVTADMVRENAVVIDVGTTRVRSDQTKSGWKLKGDVLYDEVAPKTSYITPVPGGVGPMTRVALLLNTLKATKKEIYP